MSCGVAVSKPTTSSILDAEVVAGRGKVRASAES
jgi:hypothetical protein